MSAYSAVDHNLRLELVARTDLGRDVRSPSKSLEFLREYVRYEERGCQRKSLVESSAKEPMGVILDVARQHHLRSLKRFRLRSGAIESRGKSGLRTNRARSVERWQRTASAGTGRPATGTGNRQRRGRAHRKGRDARIQVNPPWSKASRQKRFERVRRGKCVTTDGLKELRRQREPGTCRVSTVN